MSNTEPEGITIGQAQAFLATYYANQASEIALIGAGAWSRCYGFRQAGQQLAIRFGQYLDDFQKDQLAARYSSAALPVPQVLDIGHALGGYYAISTRAYGVALENMPASEWHTLVPTLVDAFEAMRLADLSTTQGYGGWGADGNALYTDWSQHLLRVDHDGPDRRTYGWRNRLASSPAGEAAFVWGFDLLQQVAHVEIPRCLVHCDLINRNVLVQGTSISGIFDWGCSIYGDHLYELAWFEFWAPWHPNLDIGYLRTALEQRWQETGYIPANKRERLIACYLHIGLDHLAYNAYMGDWQTLLETAERMRQLVAGS